jgi:hypothetical protein
MSQPSPLPSSVASYREAVAAKLSSTNVIETLPLASTMETSQWRKRLGLTNQKTFVCHSGFPDFSQALIDRGWKRVADYHSLHFDIKWTMKAKDIDMRALQPHQAVNHYEKSMQICTKAGLLHCLRTVNWFADIDERHISPRAYDLADSNDYSDFVEDFQIVEAEKSLRLIIVAVLLAAINAGICTPEELVPQREQNKGTGAISAAALGGSKVPFDRTLYLPTMAIKSILCSQKVLKFVDSSAACPLFNLGAVLAALSVAKKRVRSWDESLLDSSDVQEPTVTLREWQILRYCDIFTEGGPAEQASDVIKRETEDRAKEAADIAKRDKAIKRVLRKAGKTAAAGAVFATSKTSNSSVDGSIVAALASAAARAASASIVNTSIDTDSINDSDDDIEEDNESSEDDDDEDDDNVGIKVFHQDKQRSSSLPPQSRGLVSQSTSKILNLASKFSRRPEWGAGASSKMKNEESDSSGGDSSARKRIENKNSGAVGLFQLRLWREKCRREGFDTTAFSDSVGDPEPSVSSSDDPMLGSLSKLGVNLWTNLIDALGAINDNPSMQSSLNGCPSKNVWIVKPAGKSRGRGIECDNSLSHILMQRGGAAKESHWIVQKYIERPLLIHSRKWDIRQWVLVSSWNPLTIWMYRKCYLRFCSYPFELGNLQNKYIHLSNNSIQKHSAAFEASEIEGNMWHMDQFAKWLKDRNEEGAFDGLTYLPEPSPTEIAKEAAALRKSRLKTTQARKENVDAANATSAATSLNDSPLVQDAAELLQKMKESGEFESTDKGSIPQPISSCRDVWNEVLRPQIAKIVKLSLQSAQDVIDGRAASFEVYGFDFMIDADLHPWLIEINSSPDFSYSTAVTEELVQECSDGIASVVVDYRDWEKDVAAAKAAAKAEKAKRSTNQSESASIDSASTSTSLPIPRDAPDCGGWECIYVSPASLGSALTCMASGLSVNGVSIQKPSTKKDPKVGASGFSRPLSTISQTIDITSTASANDMKLSSSSTTDISETPTSKAASLRTRLLAATALDLSLQNQEQALDVSVESRSSQQLPPRPEKVIGMLKKQPATKITIPVSTSVISFEGSPKMTAPTIKARTQSR